MRCLMYTGSSATLCSCATNACQPPPAVAVLGDVQHIMCIQPVKCAAAPLQLGWEEAELVEKAMRKLSDYYKSDSVSIVSQVT